MRWHGTGREGQLYLRGEAILSFLYWPMQGQITSRSRVAKDNSLYHQLSHQKALRVGL